MVPGIDPTVDIVFKRLFGTEANADLLIDLLNGVLGFPPSRSITAVEILNPFNDKEALDDKLSILDIKARDAAGRQFNVEMQIEAYRAYPARVLYYLAKLHQLQMHEGDEFHELTASYSISFLDHVMYPDRPRWHWAFELRDVAEPEVLFSDQLAVHVVELPKFNRAAQSLATPCERWCYFLRHGEELDTDNLPASLQVAPIKKAMEVLRMLTQSDLERERYEARLKFRRDQNAIVHDAEMRGEERGVQRGEERGEERGVLLGRIQLCERLLQQEPTPPDRLRRWKWTSCGNSLTGSRNK